LNGALLGLLVFILGVVVGQFLNWAIAVLSPRPAENAAPPPKPAWWRRLPLIDAFNPVQMPDRWRLLGVELLAGGGFLLAYYEYDGLSPEWGVFVFYLCLMLVIAFIDLKDRLIPNRLVFPAMPLAILLATFIPIGAVTPWSIGSSAHIREFDNFLFSLAGGAIPFIILLLVAIIKPGGMGFGDVKLAGLVGLATGFPGGIIALFLAIIAGGLFAIVLVVFRRKSRRDVIPFGPFICAGMLAALLWGVPIVNWYLGLIG